jgi:3-oxoacyl-[acyl-carrier protein] reductase
VPKGVPLTYANIARMSGQIRCAQQPSADRPMVMLDWMPRNHAFAGVGNLGRAFARTGKEVFREVVNISSISGTQGNAGQINYAAAKTGVVGMTKTLAKEWGRMKVNVNCGAFGFIDTRLTQPTTEEKTVSVEGREVKVGVHPDRIAQAKRDIPLGRPGTAEEAAGSVYMFCIPESNYVTGQTLICGAGAAGSDRNRPGRTTPDS